MKKNFYRDLEAIRKRLKIRLDAEEETESESTKGNYTIYAGNTKLPYGLCKKFGIETKPTWTPSDAWKALEGIGIYHDEVLKHLQEHGDITGLVGTPKGENKSDEEALQGLQDNEIWAEAYEKASRACADIIPKDQRYNKGTDWKGDEQVLAIQGKGYVDLYNKTANKDTYLEIDEIKAHPLVSEMDALSRQCSDALGGSTVKDGSENRDKLRKAIVRAFLGIGSAKKNEDGEYVHNGKIKKEHKACVVIGLPGCGKSSTKVDPWSEKNGAFILDNDVLKSLTPEFAATNGAAAAAVHKECSSMNAKALEAFTKGSKKGENVCIPTIGNDFYGVMSRYIIPLEKAGYDVEVQFVEGGRKTSINRSINRAIQTGRIIPSYGVFGHGNKPRHTFKMFKKYANAQGKPYVRGG